MIKEIVIAIVIILIYIIISPIIINHRIFNTLTKTVPSKNFDEIKFRTGDIILYKWNYSFVTIDKNNKISFNKKQSIFDIFNDFLVSCIYGTTFFHVGVVIIWQNIPYILELSETDIFCNYDNKIAHYVPSLSSMKDIMEYKGVICRFPYNGIHINNKIIENILKSKNEYIHAWHPEYGVYKNLKHYFQDMPNIDTCGPLNKKLANTNCPKYVNCVQYICAVLHKMNIKNINKCGNITPDTLYNFCSNSLLYIDPHLIETPYLHNFI